jgi:8-oxo-dGTP pyrophosphatase MutT (NUDIX family)
MELSSGTLARGNWRPEQVHVTWSQDPYDPPPAAARAANDAIAELARRGSPSHDGTSARLVSFRATPDGLTLELQPIRWSLRLSASDALQSLAAMCVVRTTDGRWLAGHRADWLASWPGRWALGAGGSVEAGEHPVHTLRRELLEEWSLEAAQLTIEALVCLPQRLVLFVGSAWVPPDATVVYEAEHSGYAWWPSDPEQWPPEADGAVRDMGRLLAA